MSNSRGRLSALVLTLFVSACGGGGSSSSGYALGGQVIGLQPGQSVQIADASQSQVVQANGTFAFGTRLASGAAYSVSVVQAPAGRRCAVDHPSGVVASSDVQSVVVNCSGVANWVPDGPVTATALSADGSTVYFGGRFSHVGPRTGSFVALDSITGLPSVIPAVQGTVSAVAADGVGGWYIGGSFTSVGSVAKSNLAHLRADGSLDVTFSPSISSPVSALAFDGSKLYAGTWISGLFRVVALSPSGTGVQIWSVTTNGSVQTMALDGGMLYIGGAFSQAGNLNRFGLAAVNTSTGVVNAAWDANANNGAGVNKLLVANGALYVAGAFSSIGGAARIDLAALDPTTASATAWNPTVSSVSGLNDIRAIAIVGSTVYIGGTFDFVNGQARSSLAAVSQIDGSLLPWTPRLASRIFGMPGYVNALTASASTVYISGEFAQVGSSNSLSLAAVDASSGSVGTWVSGAQRAVTWLFAAGNSIWAGGTFGTLGGVDRNGLAAVDAVTGIVTPWNPGASNSTFPGMQIAPTSMAVTNSRVFVAGSFDTIGGAGRTGLAALDLTTGAALDWNPAISGSISSMVATGSTLYLSGVTAVNGQSRLGLAAIDAMTGNPTSWAPDASQVSTITAMLCSGPTLYVVGTFNSIGGQVRNAAAAFDTASGILLPWDPEIKWNGIGATPSAIAMSVGAIFVTGAFNQVGSQAQIGSAALDPSTGALLSWSPGYTGDAIAAIDGEVYLGQYSTGSGTPLVSGLTTLSASSGNPTPLQYAVTGSVYSVGVTLALIVIGGEFGGLLNESQQYLAILPR